MCKACIGREEARQVKPRQPVRSAPALSAWPDTEGRRAPTHAHGPAFHHPKLYFAGRNLMSHDVTFQHSLWQLIKEIRFGLLTHRHPDGKLRSHPLTTQNRSLDPGDPLYFFVSKKTELGQRLPADGNVCVNYADPRCVRLHFRPGEHQR
jgi:hypothetical protein